MSSFAKAVESVTNVTTTWNGAPVRATTNQPVLDFEQNIDRGTSVETISSQIDSIIRYIKKEKDVQALHDLIVLCFHIRNVRGGKGEKNLSHQIFLRLYDDFPATMTQLVHVFSHYGYFKDFLQIMTIISENSVKQSLSDSAILLHAKKYTPLIMEMVNYLVKQRKSDLETTDNNISLVGKWLPREGSKYGKVKLYVLSGETVHTASIYNLLVCANASLEDIKVKNVNNIPTELFKIFRQGNSKLTKRLEVPECLMCANRYSELQFNKISSNAMHRYTKAFLNLKLKGTLLPSEQDTGNRCPDSPDRIECRQNLTKFLSSDKAGKLKATTLQPHQIIEKLYSTCAINYYYSHGKTSLTKEEKDVLFQLWESKKEDTRKYLSEMDTTLKAIPLVDVSGSMTYQVEHPKTRTPMYQPIMVAVALGILMSEVHDKKSPYRDILMTFSANPKMVKLHKHTDLEARLKQTLGLEWGMNTDFYKAMVEMCNFCKTNKVKEEDIPNLVVFTDGGFDNMRSQNGSWKTIHQSIGKLWAKSGYNKVPTIIYWNLNASSPGFQETADYPGVQMLSGLSDSLLRYVLYGETLPETTQIIDGKEMKVSSVTPWETFRAQMDDSRYDLVRVILSDSNEGLFKNYQYHIEPDMTQEYDNIETKTSNTKTTINIIDDNDKEGFELI